MSKIIKLDWGEAKELANILTETENADGDYIITERVLNNKWNISLDDFYEIADGIFRMIDFSISPITQTAYVGISKEDGWVAKKEINQKFIHALITWVTEGNEMSKDSKGFIKTITVDGKSTFDVMIRHSNADL